MQPVTILGSKAFGLTVGRLCHQLIEDHRHLILAARRSQQKHRLPDDLLWPIPEDRFGGLALHFDTDLVGRHDIGAAARIALAEREHGRQRGRRRMGEQSVHAILGDRKYGAISSVRALDGGSRIALHARELEFSHPTGRQAVSVQAPVPADWPARTPRS